MFLPLIRLLMSTRCHCSCILRGKSKFLLSLLKHLPAEYTVSKAIDFVLFLIAETARGLNKNREHSWFLSLLPFTPLKEILLA